MKITTKDIIQILPLGEEFKKQFLADFDTLTADQKFNIEQIVWDTYGALYTIKLDKNTQEALLRAEDGEENLDKEFYKRVREKTKKEMEDQFSQAEANFDLSSTREELEKIMKQPN